MTDRWVDLDRIHEVRLRWQQVEIIEEEGSDPIVIDDIEEVEVTVSVAPGSDVRYTRVSIRARNPTVSMEVSALGAVILGRGPRGLGYPLAHNIERYDIG